VREHIKEQLISTILVFWKGYGSLHANLATSGSKTPVRLLQKFPADSGKRVLRADCWPGTCMKSITWAGGFRLGTFPPKNLDRRTPTAAVIFSDRCCIKVSTRIELSCVEGKTLYCATGRSLHSSWGSR